MNRETDLQWVIRNLEEKGEVSRNDALKIYMTRLGARINDLKNMGWNIRGEFRKTQFGRDFVYTLVKKKEPEQMRLI